MTWREVVAIFDDVPADWSPIIEVFREFGCENTIEQDSPPSIGTAVVEVDETDSVVGELRAALLEAGAARVIDRPLVEQNWDEVWRQFFKPRRIGPRVVVRPTWEDFELGPEDVEIVLDPGQAFGTGDHPTTRLCLELLQEFDASGMRVADVGCGSGILAIAADKLGAREVAGVDIEPLSVAVSRENAAINRSAAHFVEGNSILDLGEGPWDLVLSNIISATLIGMASRISSQIAPRGIWIVSGILEPNWPDVLQAAKAEGFTLVSIRKEDNWVAARLQAR